MSPHALFLDLQLRVFSNSNMDGKIRTRKAVANRLPATMSKKSDSSAEARITPWWSFSCQTNPEFFQQQSTSTFYISKTQQKLHQYHQKECSKIINRFCCLGEKKKSRGEELLQFELEDLYSETKSYKGISSHRLHIVLFNLRWNFFFNIS